MKIPRGIKSQRDKLPWGIEVSFSRVKFAALGRSVLGEADNNYWLFSFGYINFRYAQVAVHTMDWCTPKLIVCNKDCGYQNISTPHMI